MKILLGVCGSIAAYKTLDLARGLTKKGHEVRVILTKGALNFVKPEVYRYLGIQKVYLPQDDFKYPNENTGESSVLHIELAKWAEHICIYPASANTLANLAFGKAEDLLTSVFLAKREETITSIFPAMNTHMYLHPITQENMDLLKRIEIAGNLFIHPPEVGTLACGDTGTGKAPQIEKVINCINAINPTITKESPKVLITTGATIAPIDPIRFVTNASSGKTGYEMAVECLKRGYQVEVLAGKFATPLLDDLNHLPGFTIKRVTTTSEMLTVVQDRMKDFSIYISCAAISDIEFNQASEKLKKNSLGSSLEFKQAPDILKFVLENKKPEQVVIGFAAETNLSHEILNEKWQRKPVSLLVGTQVHSGLEENKPQQGFNTNDAFYRFFRNGEIATEGSFEKSLLPKLIFDNLEIQTSQERQ